jgi:hypothetical protein
VCAAAFLIEIGQLGNCINPASGRLGNSLRRPPKGPSRTDMHAHSKEKNNNPAINPGANLAQVLRSRPRRTASRPRYQHKRNMQTVMHRGRVRCIPRQIGESLGHVCAQHRTSRRSPWFVPCCKNSQSTHTAHSKTRRSNGTSPASQQSGLKPDQPLRKGQGSLGANQFA